MTDLARYVAAVRALVDELNRESASGLITLHALTLISVVDRQTRVLEREMRERADAQEGG